MRCTINDLERVSLVLSDDSIYIPINGHPCELSIRSSLAKDILIDGRVYVLMPNEFCVFIYFPHSIELYTGHSAVLPEGRGKEAIKAGKETIKWMFNNTKCIKLFGLTPIFMRHVAMFNRLVGFTKEGILTDSCSKDGALYDQTLFGLSK